MRTISTYLRIKQGCNCEILGVKVKYKAVIRQIKRGNFKNNWKVKINRIDSNWMCIDLKRNRRSW